MTEQQEIAGEAERILRREVSQLRMTQYEELTQYLEPRAFDVTSPSGRVFQVEITALWDDSKRGHLRVIVAIDDSEGVRIRDYRSDNFIIAPGGTFIGEPDGCS